MNIQQIILNEMSLYHMAFGHLGSDQAIYLIFDDLHLNNTCF